MNEQNTYDEVPYPEMAFQRTHPNFISGIASLFGLTPPDPRKARVLELGCASGCNLLPMAVTLPEAEFLGIDLSIKQIQAAEDLRKLSEIENASFRQLDILEIDDSIGQFDYIIAHGLYSWVPEIVQDKILALVKSHLSPNGVAYISYNVNPGWYFRGGLRDMMLYHVAGFSDPLKKIQQARALLNFLATQGKAGPYADMLKLEAELLRKEPDGYLYHEYLERENHPVHFHQFIDRVRTKNLAYLGETQLARMTNRTLSPEAAAILDQISGGDLIRLGQYMDFIGNMSFRESLIVHPGQRIARAIEWQSIRQLWLTCALKTPGTKFDIKSKEPITFETTNSSQIRIKDPLVKAGVSILIAAQPQPLAFGQVVEKARSMLGSDQTFDRDEQVFGEFVIEAVSLGIMNVLANPWPVASTISAQPRTSKLAGIQAKRGMAVVNLAHQRLGELSADHIGLIELLDGSRSIEAAIEIMYQRINMQRLPEAAKPFADDPQRLREMFATSMRRLITDIKNLGLLFDNGNPSR